jgi:hypothetical protein
LIADGRKRNGSFSEETEMRLKSMVIEHWEKLAVVCAGCAIVALVATGVRSKDVGQLCASVRGGTAAVGKQMDESVAPQLPPLAPPRGEAVVGGLRGADWMFYRPTVISVSLGGDPDEYQRLVAPDSVAPVADFGSVTISWKEGPGNRAKISEYRILRKKQGEAEFREIGSVGGDTLSYRDGTVAADTSYVYIVRCASDYKYLHVVGTDSAPTEVTSKRVVELDFRSVTVADGVNKAGVLVRKRLGGDWVERMFYVMPGDAIGGQVPGPFVNGRSSSVDMSSGFKLVRLDPVQVIRGACKITTIKAVCVDGRGKTVEITLAK